MRPSKISRQGSLREGLLCFERLWWIVRTVPLSRHLGLLLVASLVPSDVSLPYRRAIGLLSRLWPSTLR